MSIEPVTILLVEDDVEDALIITGMMREASFRRWQMTLTTRLQQALIELCQTSYDVVLLDLSLPDSRDNGIIQAIQTVAPQVAIIVMTGLDDDQVAGTMIALGAQDYLIKGQTDTRLLYRSVRYAIERRKLRSQLVALAADLEQANQQLQAMVVIDPLTKIYNRNYFDVSYATTWSLVRDKEFELTVVMIDLDQFRRYNAAAGFLLGDLCLQQVAAILRHHLRPSDFLARFSGEEFVVLLPNTPLSVAVVLAQKLCDAVLELRIVHSAQANELMSVSIGLANEIPQANRNPQILLERAEHALFLAKAAGGNRVTTAEGDTAVATVDQENWH